MKKSFRKKLSLMLVLVLIVSLFAGLPVNATAVSDTKCLAFSSDVHYDIGKTNNLDTWLGNMKNVVKSIDYMGFCGDLGSAYSTTTSYYWSGVKVFMDTADSFMKSGFINKGVIYTFGNHEWMTAFGGDYAKNLDNEYAKRIQQIGEAAKTDQYIVYCFGPSSATQQFTSDDIATLKAYLAAAPTNIPIIVLSHFPLHSITARTIANADAVVDVLNAHPNVIFLWGHNHSYSDTNYDKFCAAGDTLTVAAGVDKKINFTYMAAGCLSDAEYHVGSAFVKGKGLLMAIDGSMVTFNYYGLDGKALEGTKTVDVAAGIPITTAIAPDTTTHTVMLSKQSFTVDGVNKDFEAYNIDGSNYFKLRDIAFVLRGTGSNFSVVYDEAKKAINCATGQLYTADGSELVIGADQSASAIVSTQSLYIDGKAVSLTAFNIGGNNFFKLRELGEALKFSVSYDDASKTGVIKSAA